MTEDLAETNTNPNPKRSHTGCVRCKRRRQRCDEKKPQCGRCIAANITCEYAVTLRWGGRDFGRSRFGQCMKGNNNLSKLEHATNGFVYTFSAPSRKPKHAILSHLPPEIQYLSYLSLAERGLFYHFRDEASRVTSCHSHVQTELCELILPMAIESQALMYATLAWAAMHSVERRGTIDHVSDPNTCIAHLKMRSIENLRIELRNPTPENIYALLATVRTLTQCEIHSGSDGESVWRVHIEGAKALMAAVKELRSIGRIGVFDSRTQPRLLYRWFDSLDSLAALTSAGNYIQPAEPSTGSTRDEDPACDVYLDNYNGFYTDLSILLGKIGVASRAWRNQKLDGCDPAPIRAQADHFEQEVHAMMDRDQQSPLKFYPGVLEKLSPQAILEYSLCNETYQHTALIHINRRLRDLPGNSPVIQDSVKKIIECTKKIAPATGSSPLIVMATPLFTAGCEAYGQERDHVRELLVQLYENLKIRNVKLSLQILEAYWARDTKEGDWDDIFRQNNSDFIPY